MNQTKFIIVYSNSNQTEILKKKKNTILSIALNEIKHVKYLGSTDFKVYIDKFLFLNYFSKFDN